MDLNTVTAIARPRSRDEIKLFAEGDAYLAGGTWLFSEPQPQAIGSGRKWVRRDTPASSGLPPPPLGDDAFHQRGSAIIRHCNKADVATIAAQTGILVGRG
jgi:hypothetical protein